MRGVFEDKEIEPRGRRRDTELTLSSTTLLGIFFGLVLLCGLFFGLGFAVGRLGPADSGSAGQGQTAAAPASVSGGVSRPKPSATTQNVPQPQQLRAQSSYPVGSAAYAPGVPSPGASSPGTPSSYADSAAPSPNAQPQVKPALPAASYAPASQPALNVQPALAPAVSLMVQIAAVTHPEDAEVLVGALRKRGYAVSVRRQPADNLIHVQIGPFTSRDEAYRWRQKLLNDGYNAMVQP